jgi:hypothetical protein
MTQATISKSEQKSQESWPLLVAFGSEGDWADGHVDGDVSWRGDLSIPPAVVLFVCY